MGCGSRRGLPLPQCVGTTPSQGKETRHGEFCPLPQHEPSELMIATQYLICDMAWNLIAINEFHIK